MSSCSAVRLSRWTSPWWSVVGIWEARAGESAVTVPRITAHLGHSADPALRAMRNHHTYVPLGVLLESYRHTVCP